MKILKEKFFLQTNLERIPSREMLCLCTQQFHNTFSLSKQNHKWLVVMSVIGGKKSNFSDS